MAKKKKLSRTTKKFAVLAKFLLVFNLLSIPLYAAIYSDFSFRPLQVLIANISNYVLQILGYSTTVYDNIVVVAGNEILLRVDISWDSTGWKSLYALTALAVATPVAADKKIRFLAAALPAIFVINILRIVTTISVSLNYGFQYFELLHTLLWREGMIFAVVAIWLVWAHRQKYNIR